MLILIAQLYLVPGHARSQHRAAPRGVRGVHGARALHALRHGLHRQLHGQQPRRHHRRRLPHAQEELLRHRGPAVHEEHQGGPAKLWLPSATGRVGQHPQEGQIQEIQLQTGGDQILNLKCNISLQYDLKSCKYFARSTNPLCIVKMIKCANVWSEI